MVLRHPFGRKQAAAVVEPGAVEQVPEPRVPRALELPVAPELAAQEIQGQPALEPLQRAQGSERIPHQVQTRVQGTRAQREQPEIQEPREIQEVLAKAVPQAQRELLDEQGQQGRTMLQVGRTAPQALPVEGTVQLAPQAPARIRDQTPMEPRGMAMV